MTAQLQVHRAAVAETLDTLRVAGQRNCEGIVLWLGRRLDGVSIASHVYQPIHTAAADFFHIPREGMAHMLSFMGDHSVVVLAQVHSHPKEAFHSRADDQWAVVRHLGALSLVVPDFARHTTVDNFTCEAATFRLDEGNRWAPVPASRIADVLEVCP